MRSLSFIALLAFASLAGCHVVFPHAPGADAPSRADRARPGDAVRPALDLARPGDAAADRRPSDLASVASERSVQPCPSVCDLCQDGTCFIKSKCMTGCTCPAGMPCQVQCAAGSCKGNIDCSAATGCTIICGKDCAKVRCGTGACDVTCDGGCGEVDCSAASSCTIVCNALVMTSACTGLVTCGSGACEVTCGGMGPSCSKGVSCSAASSCTVKCTGASCGDVGVLCGPGPCDVDCFAGAVAPVSCAASSQCCVSNTAGAGCSATCPKACSPAAGKPCWCTGCK
jgi:hypothetical protein